MKSDMIEFQARTNAPLAALLSRMAKFEHHAIYQEPYNKKDYLQCCVLVAHLMNREVFSAPLRRKRLLSEVLQQNYALRASNGSQKAQAGNNPLDCGLLSVDS